MKLDIDYIEKILATVEEHPMATILQGDLLKGVGGDSNNPDDVDKFCYHMRRIEEVGFLDTYTENFGFSQRRGRWDLSSADYELTWSGCEFLESMRNDTLKNKMTSLFKDMALEQIKSQFPVLLTRLITNGPLL